MCPAEKRKLKNKRLDINVRDRSSFWRVLGPAEVFPFVLSLGIVVQGIIFASIQSFGLQGLFIRGCEPLSQVMLPGKMGFSCRSLGWLFM